jgi:hypothetical protein
MRTTTSIIVVLTGFILTSAPARAQTTDGGRTFVGVNVGVQPQSRTLAAGFSVPIYDQAATGATTQEVGGGPIFDLSGGYRVWSDLGIAVGFSTFSDTHEIAGTASIPHPLFTNRPALVDIGGASAERTDRNLHVLAVWFVPVTENVDVALSAGPSFTRISQDLITGVNVPAGTQQASPVMGTESGWATGVNVGADFTYLVTRNYGAGIFLRYNGGSMDLASSETTIKAGGFQIGAGARLRF